MKIKILVLLLILSSLLFFFINKKNKENKEMQKEKIRFEMISKRVDSLCELYHVDDFWTNNNKIKEHLDSCVYSFQLESFFKNKNMPILLFVEIDDIKKKNGKFIVRFNWDWNSKVNLSCKKEHIKYLLASRKDDYTGFFAIVLSVENIRKYDYEITSNFDDEYGTIDFLYSQSHKFRINGECLDLIFIEDNLYLYN